MPPVVGSRAIGRIIVHVGLPKSGSSSVQRWLARRAEVLADAFGIRLLVVRRAAEGWAEPPVVVEAYERGGANSGALVRRYVAAGTMAVATGAAASTAEGERRYVDRVLAEVEAHAEGADVVVTSEGLWQLLAEPAVPLLEALEAAAARRAVEVVAYLRPQHRFLEASWRQWGFRTGRQPSDYLGELEPHADYAAVAAALARHAPSVRCRLVPLVDGPEAVDVVEHLASQVLGVDPARVGPLDERENVGLPLHVANLLRAAPEGRYWAGPHDNGRLDRIRAADLAWPPADEVVLDRSRRVLQAWCHQRFEDGNRALARDLGWAVDGLVPAVEPPLASPPTLVELDALWSPPPAGELTATWAALDAVLGGSA